MGKRVSELTGADLDRWVANAHGMMLYTPDWQPSRNWAQGGPLIEDARINVMPTSHGQWSASQLGAEAWEYEQFGRTALEAAMRCYVESRLGSEVDDEG